MAVVNPRLLIASSAMKKPVQLSLKRASTEHALAVFVGLLARARKLNIKSARQDHRAKRAARQLRELRGY
jgi:hypothetical protein